MEKMVVGVATSISREKGFDPMDTLLFCKEHAIGLVQVYLDEGLINNMDYIHEIRDVARECGITLTAHAPVSLNEQICNEAFITAATTLLLHQKEKIVIIHYDEQEPLRKIVEHLTFLQKHDLIVGLENYHVSKTEQEFLSHIDTYNSIFSIAHKDAIPVYPVLDIPRLFITDIFNKYDSLILIEQIMDHMARFAPAVILHLIDFLDYNQHRESWCPLGTGLMPYATILNHALQQGITFHHGVLEYEDKELALKSIKHMESWETIFKEH